MAAADNSKQADAEANTLKEDYERLRKDFQALRSHLKEMGGRRIDQAGSRGREQVDEIEEMLRELGSDLRGRGELGQAKLEQTIQERPLMSLLAAFGVGMLISQLLGGRRR